DWARSAWLDPAPAGAAPGAAGNPTPAYAAPVTAAAGADTAPAATQPVTPDRRSHGGAGLGQIVVAAALSAVLASGGTFLVLEGTGALDQSGNGGGVPQVPTPTGRGPIPIEDSSSVVKAAAAVSPAVVRIIVEGV